VSRSGDSPNKRAFCPIIGRSVNSWPPVSRALRGPAGLRQLLAPRLPGPTGPCRDKALEEHPPREVAAPDGSRLVFSARTRTSHIRRTGARGAIIWSHAIRGMQPLDAVLVLDGDTLFAALYRASVSGCRVIALDARSGALRWETELEGVGPVAHSAYRTLVQMRLDPAGLVIYGNEFKGRYIEVLRPADGRLVGRRFLGR
jgi:hypothetical protein